MKDSLDPAKPSPSKADVTAEGRLRSRRFWITVLLILVDATLAQAGQTFLKIGINHVKELIETTPVDVSTLSQLSLAVGEWTVWVGLIFYILSVILWLVILSREDLVVAFPLLTVGYVIALLVAYFVLDEPVTEFRVVGTLIICLGIGILLSERDPGRRKPRRPAEGDPRQEEAPAAINESQSSSPPTGPSDK